MLSNPHSYVKAILGGTVAALSFAIPVIDDGLVASEILGVVLAGLTGFGVVFGASNSE